MKHRSTTFICGECGKCHTFYGKEADDIHNANSVLCSLDADNEFWSNKLPHFGIIRRITTLFECCKNPRHITWEYKIMEDEQ